MDNQDQQLDKLFKTAAEQAPEASFEETRKAFVAGAAAAAGIGFGAWMAQFFTKKVIIIMLSSTTILATTVAVLVSTQPAETDQAETMTPMESQQPAIEQVEEPLPNELPLVTTETLLVAGEVELEISNDPDHEEVEITNETTPEEPTPAIAPEQPKPAPYAEAAAEPQAGHVQHDLSCTPLQAPTAKAAEADTTQLTNVMYIVTNESTYQEFETISEAAKAVGITFKYTLRVRKNRIKKVDLRMSFKNEQTDSRKHSMANGNFELVIGWSLNQQGKVVSFYNGEDVDDLPDGKD